MNVGLIAHDSKKKLMQNFCIAYKNVLAKNELFATGTTGRLIEEVTGLRIHKYLAGHLGGQQQMAAQISNNELDMVETPLEKNGSVTPVLGKSPVHTATLVNVWKASQVATPTQMAHPPVSSDLPPIYSITTISKK